MTRNLKALGLAAFACLAMGAMFASTAQAVENPTANSQPGTQKAKQKPANTQKRS